NWGDYPILGFNGNWVVVSLNFFAVKGGRYRGTSLYVFSKSDLFQNGDNYITFNDNQGGLIPASDLDNHPEAMYFVQAFADPGARTVRLGAMQGEVRSASFGGGNVRQISVPDPWDDFGAEDTEFAPQAGTATHIDAGHSRLQNCVMRAGTIWCAN